MEVSTANSREAPGELELVRSFVNTWDAEDRAEALDTPAALASWLAAHGLLAPEGRVGPAALARAIGVREALRAALLANAGRELEPEATATLESTARRARLSVRFDRDARAAVEPLAGGVDGALGRLLAAVAVAQRDGTWPRLKACRADDCRWAYYDRSRNRSASWCDMAVCGNRSKVRSYRERRLTGAGSPAG
jgi:predicted RNA-binding Zn ribbon-like protein